LDKLIWKGRSRKLFCFSCFWKNSFLLFYNHFF